MATKFQKRVWAALELIPEGKVTTYKEVANFLNTKGVRAVANAIAKNPYAPKVPCHRVVKSNGKVGGYSGGEGVKTKIELLKKEGVIVKNEKVKDFKNIVFYFSDVAKL